MNTIDRALIRLSAPNALLAPAPNGPAFAVYPSGDRRRRPLARLGAAEVQALSADGAISALPDKGAFVITEAGRARVRRAGAQPQEAFLAQHRPVETRSVIDADGGVRSVRGHEAHLVLRRLSALRDARGGPWLAPEETAAALRLRQDWDAGQVGLVRGSDWSAPPRSDAGRGPGNAREAAMAVGCDARRRVETALAGLAAPLRRVVERVCLHEHGLEALEREEGWPSRSGKIALKLGLAQLAAQRR